MLYFVWLAAHQRKNWPRWVLAVALVLSVFSLFKAIDTNGVELDSGIEIVSCVFTAAGLYFSYTGDAQGWFKRIKAGLTRKGWFNAQPPAVISGGLDSCARQRNPVNSGPWNGPMTASCWGFGGMANPPPSSNS